MANIFESMVAIMTDIDAVGKNQKNQQQGFKFRGIDDVYNAVHPILAKHGVFTVPTVLNERTEERQTQRGGNLIYRILTMKYTFFASDGSYFETTVIGEGMDSGDKAANKAMAVAHKYALLQALCIPTEDMVDPDSETHSPSRKQTVEMQKLNSVDDAKKQFKSRYQKATLSVDDFTVKAGWNDILRLCKGNKDSAKKLFEKFGAASSKDITFEIYKKVNAYLCIDVDDANDISTSLDEIPFENSKTKEIA
jgi:hypothetical protein